MEQLIPPRREILACFKSELWKDQRSLRQDVLADGSEILIKSFQTELEANQEANVLGVLQASLTNARVPRIVGSQSNVVQLEYIRGIRLFNLLVELDLLAPQFSEQANKCKKLIIDKSEQAQRDIQIQLLHARDNIATGVYPAANKTLSILSLLTELLQIAVNREVLTKELDLLTTVWHTEATVPFRDATTKNMVLAAPNLWLGNYDSEDERRSYMQVTFAESAPTLPEWVYSDIVDFDFSSCVELSTPEDDPISLKFHERTWAGPPRSADALIWDVGTSNNRRAALTFLVRYYRFGGRKAAYRLLHPWGHRVRFRYDSDVFYFERLPSIIRRLWSNADEYIPVLLGVTEAIAKALGVGRPSVDYFISSGLGERRRYYVDMFPE